MSSLPDNNRFNNMRNQITGNLSDLRNVLSPNEDLRNRINRGNQDSDSGIDTDHSIRSNRNRNRRSRESRSPYRDINNNNNINNNEFAELKNTFNSEINSLKQFQEEQRLFY